ncbi:unnamed protein product [Acanthoscelides obtectus]|uniref:Uncharacterized protein n=1 Tax=Acanthoscelides obtectus TaxID=200917 RepID=A0A9P0PQW1_ACAOB|nr:unnamed protein product [Acanthoscelides obtectus]CAK1656559.1 hypothetical protein AOBTE_LOCUS19802 [Acanthoscelides obtectus]
MNPATIVLFSCMAIMAQAAVIVDPTTAAIALNGGVGSKPFGIGRFADDAAGLFNLIGRNRCIGGVCSPNAVSNCIGAECDLVEDQVRKVVVQKQLQKLQAIQNVQMIEQNQLKNEQESLQEVRMLAQEAGLQQQVANQQAQLQEQAAFVDITQQLHKVQLLDQLRAAQIKINQAASSILWNPVRGVCGPTGCFLTKKTLVDPRIARVFQRPFCDFC